MLHETMLYRGEVNDSAGTGGTGACFDKEGGVKVFL